MKKDQYVIMSNNTPDTEDLGEALRETMAISRTFYKAYNIGLSLAGVNSPDMKYRKSLELIKKNNVVIVTQNNAENSFTVAKLKYY